MSHLLHTSHQWSFGTTHPQFRLLNCSWKWSFNLWSWSVSSPSGVPSLAVTGGSLDAVRPVSVVMAYGRAQLCFQCDSRLLPRLICACTSQSQLTACYECSPTYHVVFARPIQVSGGSNASKERYSLVNTPRCSFSSIQHFMTSTTNKQFSEQSPKMHPPLNIKREPKETHIKVF